MLLLRALVSARSAVVGVASGTGGDCERVSAVMAPARNTARHDWRATFRIDSLRRRDGETDAHIARNERSVAGRHFSSFLKPRRRASSRHPTTSPARAPGA